MSQSPTSRTDFDNPASQEERAEVLKADTANTRVAYGDVVDPLPQGRWKKPSPPQDPTTLYPRIASGPWGSGPQVPDEPPLGIDVSYVEPCGEPFEQERAAEIAAAGSGYSSLPSDSEADLASPLLGSAPGPSPVPEVSSPLSSDDSATDPTPSSSRGSTAGLSSSSDQRQLAHPSPLFGPVHAEGLGTSGVEGERLSSVVRRLG